MAGLFLLIMRDQERLDCDLIQRDKGMGAKSHQEFKTVPLHLILRFHKSKGQVKWYLW